MNNEEMSEEDANDYFCYNIADAYLGEFTPLFLQKLIDE